MIVDEGRKIVFLHNPKAGGTSIRTELLKRLDVPDTFRYQGFFRDRRDGAYHMENMSHLDFEKVAAYLSPHRLGQYRFFGILRDPFARFLSAIKEFEVKRHDWYTRFGMSLVDFLWEMLTPESVWLPEFPWFRPQAAFFPQGDSVPYTTFMLEDPHLEEKISRFLFDAPGSFQLSRLNAKGGDVWFESLPQQDQDRLVTLCQYLYTYDYEFCVRHNAHYKLLTPPVPLNHSSYLWKVRSIQTPKVNPHLEQPPHDDSTLYEEILTTEPPKCG